MQKIFLNLLVITFLLALGAANSANAAGELDYVHKNKARKYVMAPTKSIQDKCGINHKTLQALIKKGVIKDRIVSKKMSLKKNANAWKKRREFFKIRSSIGTTRLIKPPK